MVFGGATGEEIRASMLGWALGGDSSRSRREESLLGEGIALNWVWNKSAKGFLEEKHGLAHSTGVVARRRAERRRGVAITDLASQYLSNV